MVFRIGWISMGGQLSCEFGEKPVSINESGPPRQTRRAVVVRRYLRTATLLMPEATHPGSGNPYLIAATVLGQVQALVRS